MAPEQATKPADVDHRADIYALGVVFYQMLTGELPAGKIEPPSRKVQMDVRLDEVVLKALEKEPERRYQQVSEVKTRVEIIAACVPGPVATPGNQLSTAAIFLFNPFAQLTGPQSLLIGLVAILAAGFIGFYGHTHFDGVLDTHPGIAVQLPLWLFLSEGFVDWLCLAMVLLVFGKVMSKLPFRSMDLFGAQALARWPTLLMGLCLLPSAVARYSENILKQIQHGGPLQFHSPDAIIFFAAMIAMIPLFFWMVWLMYKSYNVSCKLPVGRAVATFIPALILAEFFSKIAINQLFKLI
jgi:serine/threonine protein kinase